LGLLYANKGKLAEAEHVPAEEDDSGFTSGAGLDLIAFGCLSRELRLITEMRLL
jgi:hypothetical protein